MKQKRDRYKTGEKSLTPQNQKRLMGAIDVFKDEVLIKVDLALGARRSDIIRLTWENIDVEKCAITYLQKKKGDKVHTAYVPPGIILLLKKWREFCPGKWVFPGQSTGTHLCGRTAYNIFNKYMRAAGIIQQKECWPFHSLRATCVKNLQNAGWNIEKAAKHIDDTTETVMECYSTPSTFEMMEAAKEVDYDWLR